MIEPLVNGDNLSFAEARDKYREVENAFAQVRRNYSSWDRWLGKDMLEQDIETLKSCVGVLRPLSFSPVVQTEFERTAHYNETLYSKVSFLGNHILSYANKFKNTGVYFAGMVIDEAS